MAVQRLYAHAARSVACHQCVIAPPETIKLDYVQHRPRSATAAPRALASAPRRRAAEAGAPISWLLGDIGEAAKVQLRCGAGSARRADGFWEQSVEQGVDTVAVVVGEVLKQSTLSDEPAAVEYRT